MTQLATFVYALAILGLFALDRDRSARTSKALWLPVVWLLIAGSRAVSVWLQMGPVISIDHYFEGSPLDRSIYAGLIGVGLIVLFARRRTVQEVLGKNGPIIAFVFYCALSILWSDYPDVAFKRWIKSLGDFIMILIVLTDPDRAAAVKRVLARVGFLLLPVSVLLIKYYPDLGRGYSRWEGTAYYNGVAVDKNMLGMACLVFGLASSWRFFQELGDRRIPRRNGPLIAHGSILAITLWLFWMANSMTSLFSFLFAFGLIAATSYPRIGRRLATVHFLVVAVLVLSFSTLFLDLGNSLISAIGRDPTLTGRTVLWEQLLGMTAHPILGTGFESFWLGKRLETLWNLYWWQPNESHNGYLEVYLNLGWIGLVLLAALLVTGYRNVIRLLTRDPEAGRLRLAYFVVGVAYNFTEAAIRTMDLVWIMLVLAVIALPESSVAKSRPATTGLPKATVVQPEGVV